MCDERNRLISELESIRKNGYIVDGVQKRREYMALMLGHIGDPDPFLRDELIYINMYEWIEVRDYFDEEQLKNILSVLMDEGHLFFHIGSDGDNSVFTRTFSALGVALILSRHRKKAVLRTGGFNDLRDKAILYYTSEKDLRGYTGESGWAHGAAHGADVMDELIQCGESGEETAREVLSAFKKVMYNGKYVFHNEEDERIGRAVFRIMKRNLLPKQDISGWLETLGECAIWESDRTQYVARVNAKNLLRCLYFKLTHCGGLCCLADMVYKSEEKLNRFLQADKDLIEA